MDSDREFRGLAILAVSFLQMFALLKVASAVDDFQPVVYSDNGYQQEQDSSGLLDTQDIPLTHSHENITSAGDLYQILLPSDESSKHNHRCKRAFSNTRKGSKHSSTKLRRKKHIHTSDAWKFPKNFLFGAAVSAYQTEGGWNSDGKGLSIWDHMTHEVYPGMENGDSASKSYPDNYIEDVKLLKKAGFHMYRFSVSWTRILPDGELKDGGVNEKGVQYYRNLIDQLIAANIQPVITIYHWDLPWVLQDGFGGWTNPLIVDYVEDYADLLFSLFGDSVKWWITINEPTFILHGYEHGEVMRMAPGKTLFSPANYIVCHNMLRAHARIYHLYNNKYRSKQHGKIGISLVGSTYRPKNPDSEEDKSAVKEAYEFYLGLFAHPIFTEEGGYPKLVREIVDENSKEEGRKRSRLPTFTHEEKQSLKGSSDFFGLNHYLTELISRTGKKSKLSGPRENPLESYRDDLRASNHMIDTDETGFREILNYIKDKYGNPPILVTENGYGIRSERNDKNLNDTVRVDYFKRFLGELLKAIHEDRCKIIGYIVWTLIDGLEWSRGTKISYGITHVDFEDEDRQRTPRMSYEFLKQVIKDGYLKPGH